MTIQRFAILSIGRSGTNYFATKIAFLPGVLFAWEPFNQAINDWFGSPDVLSTLPEDLRNILCDVNRRDRNHEEFYREVFSPESKLALPGVAALGFKLFPDHSPNLFWQVATDAGIKVIVLDRKNRFETFASYVMAAKENNFTMTEFNRKGVVVFDPVAFDLFVMYADAIYEGLKVNLRLNNVKFIYLYYEDFINSEEPFIRACEFVGVPYEKRESGLQKQITIKPVDLFANKDKLIGHLQKYYSSRFELDHEAAPRRKAKSPEGEPAPAAAAEGDSMDAKQLRAMLAEQNVERVALAADAFHHGQRAGALQAELAAVLGSTSWRMTASLRGALGRVPKTARLLRRAAKLVWWTATLQLFSRLSERRRLQGR